MHLLVFLAPKALYSIVCDALYNIVCDAVFLFPPPVKEKRTYILSHFFLPLLDFWSWAFCSSVSSSFLLGHRKQRGSSAHFYNARAALQLFYIPLTKQVARKETFRASQLIPFHGSEYHTPISIY